MRLPRIAVTAIVLAGAGGLIALGLADSPAASAGSRSATATLRLANGNTVGSVEFATESEQTTVKVTLDAPQGAAAADAFHGFHVHANDDTANGAGCEAKPEQPAKTWFASADGHLKSDDGQVHGGHDGDMPPLLVDAKGHASAEFTTDRLTADKLDGRAVVVHAGPDNLDNVPIGAAPDQYTANSPTATEKTQATGNAGDRIACGIIHKAD